MLSGPAALEYCWKMGDWLPLEMISLGNKDGIFGWRGFVEVFEKDRTKWHTLSLNQWNCLWARAAETGNVLIGWLQLHKVDMVAF